MLLLGSETTKIILNCKGTQRDIKGELKNFLEYVESGIIKGEFTGELNEEVTRKKRCERECELYGLRNGFIGAKNGLVRLGNVMKIKRKF